MTQAAGLVVIGHGPAGAAAAAAFRERDKETPVTVLTGENMPCYSRPRLPEVVAGQIAPEAIKLHPDEWYSNRKLSVCVGRSVARIDRGRKAVIVKNGGELPYTKLILAMGAVPVEPPIPGLPSPHVFVLRTADDALAIHARASGRKTAALIGGGLLGLEAGYALTRLGLRVAVVEAAPWLLPRQVDPEGSALLQERLRPLGFDFFLGAKVERLQAENDQVGLFLGHGRKLTADLALLSAGIAPQVQLARDAGVAVQRGVIVDDQMRTSDPDIFAAGDAAEWKGAISGLWPAAQAMGRVAGANAAGALETYPGQVPSTTLKVAGVDLCSQGDIHSEGAQIRVYQAPERGYWAKAFIRERVLAGSIQIGSTAGALQLKRLMDKRLPLDGFEDRILTPGFDFNRMPGFAD